MSVGDCVPVRLDSLAAGGEAVGRHEGMAVFAMWGCPGDEAEVVITQVSRRFSRGVVRSVVTASADRIEAPCPHFGDCGGCQLQHIEYAAQLRHKAAMVRDALARIGGLPEVEVCETWGMENPWFYRGRAQYHARLSQSGEVFLGFTRHHSHDVVALTECNIQHPLSERIRKAVAEVVSRVAQGASERAALLGVETLVSSATGRGLVTLVCDRRPRFASSAADALMSQVDGLSGVLAARRRGRGALHRSPAQVLAGEAHVTEELGGNRFRVSADSFFQTNPAQAARIIALAQEWAEVGKDDVVLDLYSGVGTFLLPLARSAHRGIGVESEASAFADARYNQRRWRLQRLDLYERKVERMLPRLVERGMKASIVVLDPPRKGCGPVVCALAAKLSPRRIILISCDPATLARDLKSLAEYGYRARRVQPVDMFPQTWHVETVAVCDRSG
jgi:23S rRNA (uracil1939-C5)-methyltransferase